MSARFCKRLVAFTSCFVGASVFMRSTECEAWAWGFGKNGELGIGSESNSALPKKIRNLSFQDIDACKWFSAGVTAEGKLFTWGKNANGVLGHTQYNISILLPQYVELEAKVERVFCGYQHLCALTKEGIAYVWGLERKKENFREKSTELIPNVPIKINLKNIIQAACASNYLLFLNKDGEVYILNDNQFKSNAPENEIKKLNIININKISCGQDFSMALTKDGKVYAWGTNRSGQLGTGTLKSVHEPIIIEAFNGEKIIDICCGDNYSGVVTEKGEVYTWGFGNEGQLGHGDKSDQLLPRKIMGIDDDIESISCGGGHTALLGKSGALWMMGRGREGQLGRSLKDESNSGYILLPKTVEQLPYRNIKKVACGSVHTLVLIDELY